MQVPPRELGAAVEEWAAQAQVEVNKWWQALPSPQRIDLDAHAPWPGHGTAHAARVANSGCNLFES